VGTDVTEIKRFEAELHASQTFRERAARVASIGGWELQLSSGQTLRATDSIARLGGEEFAVILEGLSAADAAASVAAKIVAAMNQPFALDAQAVSITTSIGVAFYQGGSTTPAELVRQADEMKSSAVKGGRS